MNALKLVPTEKHALKVENLEIPVSYAEEIVNTLRDFLTDLNFSDERIDSLECRSRDGFSAYSHNKGGLEAIAFQDAYNAHSSGTGFTNADATLEQYYKYDLERWLEENKHPSSDSMNESDWESFDEYRMSDQEATVLYSCDLMLTSETELNIRICVCVKDAPYHRKFDDKLEFDIKFKSIAGLKQKLSRLLKNRDVLCFKQNVTEAY